MDLIEAAATFARATRHCDNLVDIHRKHGGSAKGRRDKETTLNRAVVVLTIAAWQAVVQDLAYACVDYSNPGPTSSSYGMFKLLSGRARKEIGDFATPNAQNTRNLLIAAGFDPRPCWTWRTRGGRGRASKLLQPHDIEAVIDAWLKVRHAIAHGHAQLPQMNVLQAVRLQTINPSRGPSLRLIDAEQCLAFVRLLAKTTGGAIATGLGLFVPAEWT